MINIENILEHNKRVLVYQESEDIITDLLQEKKNPIYDINDPIIIKHKNNHWYL